MDIHLEKLELMEMLLQTESKTVLAKIRNIFSTEYKQTESMLSEEQWAIVEEERAQYLNGEGENYSLEEVKQLLKNR